MRASQSPVTNVNQKVSKWCCSEVQVPRHAEENKARMMQPRFVYRFWVQNLYLIMFEETKFAISSSMAAVNAVLKYSVS